MHGLSCDTLDCPGHCAEARPTLPSRSALPCVCVQELLVASERASFTELPTL